MAFLASILPYIQIALSLILVALILLQQTGAGIGSALGGDSLGAGYHTRRGAEKTLFNATIVIAVLFALAAFAALIV